MDPIGSGLGPPGNPVVGVIMGSQSDWETMQHAAKALTDLGVPHECRVVSAHRTPDQLFEYAAAARVRQSALNAGKHGCLGRIKPGAVGSPAVPASRCRPPPPATHGAALRTRRPTHTHKHAHTVSAGRARGRAGPPRIARGWGANLGGFLPRGVTRRRCWGTALPRD